MAAVERISVSCGNAFCVVIKGGGTCARAIMTKAGSLYDRNVYIKMPTRRLRARHPRNASRDSGDSARVPSIFASITPLSFVNDNGRFAATRAITRDLPPERRFASPSAINSVGIDGRTR